MGEWESAKAKVSESSEICRNLVSSHLLSPTSPRSNGDGPLKRTQRLMWPMDMDTPAVAALPYLGVMLNLFTLPYGYRTGPLLEPDPIHPPISRGSSRT